MSKKHTLIALGAFLLGFTGLLIWLSSGSTIAVLEPKGVIAEQQRDLLVFATILSLLVILPVFALTIYISWKYRASNKKATYEPEWDHNRRLETAWWGIPFAIILVLSVVTWQTSHALDPFKPIVNGQKPVTIQVVALQWKWLFIYPEYDIATVNKIYLPKDTPVEFQITSDAPMNAFWIPQLGGQVYAMSGMSTKLHLMATEEGVYNGVSANISGEGFSDMKFAAHATSQSGFDEWIRKAKQSSHKKLDQKAYTYLQKPSKGNAALTFSSVDRGLYDTIINKYMGPPSGGTDHAGTAHKVETAKENIHANANNHGGM